MQKMARRFAEEKIIPIADKLDQAEAEIPQEILDEMGKLAIQSREDIGIESICAVFAESEIISLIHKRCRPEDIARAVFSALANRIYTLIIKVGFERNLAMVGGIANNRGLVKAIEEKTGCTVFVPHEPIIVGAIGAALIACDKKMVGS